MHTPRQSPATAKGFTLAEVTIAVGIAAGVLAILTMLMGTLTRDVQRLKPYEAWKRRAFVGTSDSKPGTTSSTPNTGSTSTSNTNTNTQTDTTQPPPTDPLPDANLDPNNRPDENALPPDPDTPTTPPTDPSDSPPNSETTGDTNGTSPP